MDIYLVYLWVHEKFHGMLQNLLQKKKTAEIILFSKSLVEKERIVGESREEWNYWRNFGILETASEKFA